MFSNMLQSVVAAMALCTVAVNGLVTPRATAAVVDIAIFPASDAYLADQSVANSALTALANTAGNVGVYNGLQLEDPTLGVIVTVWDTLAESEAAIKIPAVASALKPALAAGATISTQDLPITNNGESIFSAPLSEFAVWTLHAGETIQDAAPGTQALVQGLDAAPGTFAPSTSGQSTQNPSEFIVFAGWLSLEAHESAVSTPEFQKLINDVLAIADLSIFHANLKKFA